MFRSTIPESRLRSGPELVPVVDDAALPFLTQLPERGLDLHPDLHRRGVDIDDLGGEAAAFLHLVDREDVRLHHLVLGGRVVDDRVRHHGPLPVEFDPLHLPHALPPAHRAHGPRREVQRPAGPAPRPAQGVPAPGLPPQPPGRPLPFPPPTKGPPRCPPPPPPPRRGPHPPPPPLALPLPRLPAELPHDLHGLRDSHGPHGLPAGL